MLQLIRTINIWFYALTIWKAVAITLFAICVWMLLHLLLEKHRKVWNWVNGIALTVALAVIGYAVLLRSGYGRQIIWQPFYTIQRASQNKEAYREALMNVILFVPLGLTLPHVFVNCRKSGKWLWLTMLCSLLLSTVVETLQYIFVLGVSETDDILCNVLGALIAAMHIPLCTVCKKHMHKKE